MKLYSLITYLFSFMTVFLFAMIVYKKKKNQKLFAAMVIIAFIPFANMVAGTCAVLYDITSRVLNRLDNQ